jgi:hypothetical protein
MALDQKALQKNALSENRNAGKPNQNPSDYRIARLIFGDIEANACPVDFTFGKNGKPFYIDGPNDTPAIKRRILKQLERRCGPGGYDYLITVSDSDRLR